MCSIPAPLATNHTGCIKIRIFYSWRRARKTYATETYATEIRPTLWIFCSAARRRPQRLIITLHNSQRFQWIRCMTMETSNKTYPLQKLTTTETYHYGNSIHLGTRPRRLGTYATGTYHYRNLLLQKPMLPSTSERRTSSSDVRSGGFRISV